MIQRFVNYLIDQQVITPDEADVQIFALTTLSQMVMAHGAIFILAAIFGVFVETILFELIFMPMRSYAGGFHASTPGRCFVLSLAVWGAIMAAAKFTPAAYHLLSFAVLLIAAVIIWLTAPVPHANNPIGPKRFAQVKRIVRWLLLLDVAVIAAVYLWFDPGYALACALTLLACACSLLAAKGHAA